MHVKTTLLLLSLLFLSIMAASANDKNVTGDMIIDGNWHGDEVVARDGESWLALVKNNGVYALQEVRVSVTLVEDAVVDTPPAKTGKQVSLPDGIEAIVLLRNIPQLKSGPVPSAEIVDRDFSAGKPTGIYFNGMTYELEIRCDESLRGEKMADCPMELTDGSQHQAITSYPVFNPAAEMQSIASEAFPQLFWAGDLDGDNRLDLILDLTDHYNVSAPTLLLSSRAQKGELVHPVAEFRTTGC